MILGVPLSEIAWLALAVVIGGVITVILARLARRLWQRALEITFSCFLVLVSLRFPVSLF